MAAAICSPLPMPPAARTGRPPGHGDDLWKQRERADAAGVAARVVALRDEHVDAEVDRLGGVTRRADEGHRQLAGGLRPGDEIGTQADRRGDGRGLRPDHRIDLRFEERFGADLGREKTRPGRRLDGKPTAQAGDEVDTVRRQGRSRRLDRRRLGHASRQHQIDAEGPAAHLRLGRTDEGRDVFGQLARQPQHAEAAGRADRSDDVERMREAEYRRVDAQSLAQRRAQGRPCLATGHCGSMPACLITLDQRVTSDAM